MSMSVALLWVVSPTSEVSNGTGLLDSVREGNRVFVSSRFLARDRNLMWNGRIKKGGRQRWNFGSLIADPRYSCLGGSRTEKGSSFSVQSSLVASPAGEMTVSSEKKVYDVVLKQAALVKRQLRSTDELEVKPDIVVPGNLGLLSEAYDRCGEVCAEYAKTFYLGTKLMTPERRRAIWAIYVWCRRTDELVDGPNASHITPQALDRWEARLEDIFSGRPFDMLDAALSDTVSRFPVDIQPFRDMIEGMRMDLWKSRYNNFDELYLYCYYVAGTVGLMSVPVMGIAPESKATTESVYNAALALGLANQLTNILRDVGEDARRGRVYLPQDELAQAGLSDEDIFAGRVTDKWRNFMKKQIQRARKFFDESEKGVTELDSASRWPVLAALLLYRKILDEIEANDYNNFLNLFCELTCSPNQSQFINVTSISKVKSNSTVDGIDFFITDTFGEGLYESCKDVKFGTMNTRAIEFIGAGAKNFREWYAFIGRRAAPGVPGSPYAINFKPTAPESSGMKPMNVSTYSCGDTSLGCSCGDCPSASACSSSAPPPAQREDSCSVRIGSLKVKCIEVAVTILYVVLVSVFLGWGFLHKKREETPVSRTKPLIRATRNGVIRQSSRQKDENIPMQMLEDVPQISSGIQLSIVQGYMSKFYRRYGTWVARNPILVLCSSLFIVLVLCLGLFRFKVETRPEKLWVGHGSRAAEEKLFFDSHLAPFYRIEQLIIGTISDADNGNSPPIVTEDNIKLLFDIQKKIDAIQGNYSGSMVSLTDICMKPLGTECATQSILQYFKMDSNNFDSYGGIEHVQYCFQHYTSAESCLSAFKAPLDPSTAVGGFSGNNYSEASAFIVTYPVNNAIDKEGNYSKKAVAWEKAFIQLVKDEILPMVQAKNLSLAFSSESSVEEELKRESTADAITILISYLVMFAYISLTLGDTPRFSFCYISSKVLLGLSGVILVMLSVLGSVGFFSAVGVKSTLIIMEVIPFLVLAVGVDNMCILVNAVKRQPMELPLEGRISNALVEVGPSITLASLSEVLAFAVGSFIPMPACRVFSMFAALAVLLDFLLQVTAFVALICFDFLRAEDNRIDCFPCIKVSGSNADPDKGNQQRKPGLLVRYMKDIHAPILSLWGVKLVVICVFAAFALASIALCTRVEPGLEQQIVLPRDSYLQGYFNNISDYLRIGPPLYFVVKNYNYSSDSRQTNQLCSISQCDSDSLLNEIARASLTPESSYIAKPAASWLDDFLVWISPEAFGCCRKFTNSSFCPPDDQPPCCSPSSGSCSPNSICKDCTTCFRHSDLANGRPTTQQFREKLPWFLNALPSSDCAKGGNGAYTTNVELEGYEAGIIKASAFRTYHTPLNKQVDYVNSMRAARDFSSRLSDSLKMEIFPYAVFYMFFEQYLSIWRTALINLAIAIGAVFIVCLVITCSLWTSAIILLVLAMIVLDLMGVMAILKIQLNAVSVVNLVMSVGIAVEFCVHITHAFLVSSGDRNQRMKEALTTMGASVFSGITLTKLVGVLVLCFSRTEVFVVYYFQMYLALVLLGFLHGLVFLPVLLSMFGPPSRCVLVEKQEDRPSTSSQF